MNEQFTEAYIEFIQGDTVLQEEHAIQLGEWRVLVSSYQDSEPWFVTRGTGLGLVAEGMRANGETLGCLYAQNRSKWLPSLFDLVQIIEGAGCGYTLTSSCGAKCLLDHIENKAVEGADIMVKFARLAVRALEEKSE